MRDVGVFLDYKNVLKGAERTSGMKYEVLHNALSPLRLARELVALRYGDDARFALSFVEVHFGVVNPRAPENVALAARWTQEGDEVLPRLRHRDKHEVGVDMACALSCVHAVLGNQPRCGSVILFSSDADLRPVTEFINRDGPPDAVRTASWWAPGKQPIQMPTDSEHGGSGNVRVPLDVLQRCLLAEALS